MSALPSINFILFLGISLSKTSIRMLVIKYVGTIYAKNSGIIPKIGLPVEVLINGFVAQTYL